MVKQQKSTDHKHKILSYDPTKPNIKHLNNSIRKFEFMWMTFASIFQACMKPSQKPIYKSSNELSYFLKKINQIFLLY